MMRQDHQKIGEFLGPHLAMGLEQADHRGFIAPGDGLRQRDMLAG